MEGRNKASAFWIMLITQTLSLVGSHMSSFAVGIWVYRQTGSATPLALVSFFGIVPAILLSNVAGMIADRFDRRHVMFFSNVGQAVSSIFLIASFLSGNFQLWHLYAVALIQATFGVFLGPAFQSSITMLTNDSQRDRANAINQLTGPLAGVLAPGIAGALYAFVGVTGVVVIDLISFIVAGIAAIAITIPRPEASAEGKALGGSAWRELVGGFRYLWSRRVLFFLVIYASVINFAFNGCGTIFTPYILARTNSEGTLGLIMSVMNMGAIAGGLLMSVWGGTRPRMHTIMPGLIVSGVCLALYGMSQNPWALGLSLLVLMFPLPMVNAAFMSILQLKVPPDLQGRVFAVVGQLGMLLSPIAFLTVAPLADNMAEPTVAKPGWGLIAPLVGNSKGAGMGLIMVVCGLAVALVTVAVYTLPAVRHMEADLPDYEPEKEEPVPAEELPELVTA